MFRVRVLDALAKPAGLERRQSLPSGDRSFDWRAPETTILDSCHENWRSGKTDGSLSQVCSTSGWAYIGNTYWKSGKRLRPSPLHECDVPMVSFENRGYRRRGGARDGYSRSFHKRFFYHIRHQIFHSSWRTRYRAVVLLLELAAHGDSSDWGTG